MDISYIVLFMCISTAEVFVYNCQDVCSDSPSWIFSWPFHPKIIMVSPLLLHRTDTDVRRFCVCHLLHPVWPTSRPWPNGSARYFCSLMLDRIPGPVPGECTCKAWNKGLEATPPCGCEWWRVRLGEIVLLRPAMTLFSEPQSQCKLKTESLHVSIWWNTWLGT